MDPYRTAGRRASGEPYENTAVVFDVRPPRIVHPHEGLERLGWVLLGGVASFAMIASGLSGLDPDYGGRGGARAERKIHRATSGTEVLRAAVDDEAVFPMVERDVPSTLSQEPHESSCDALDDDAYPHLPRPSCSSEADRSR